MMSPAQRHQVRIAALQLAGDTPAGGAGPRPVLTGPAATLYNQMLVKLAADKRRLSGIQSIEKRIELKRTLLAGYDDYVAGVLGAAAEDGATAVQDEIVVTIMIWRIDVGDFEAALPLVAHVLRWNLALPAKFERDAATLVVEEMANTALKQLGRGEAVDVALLDEVDALTDAHDMPDEVRAKMKMAIGRGLLKAAEDPKLGEGGPAGLASALFAKAKDQLTRAIELDSHVGAKRDLELADRALKRATGTEEATK